MLDIKDKSRNKKTTGLGVSIAKEITTRLGGKIEIYYNNERLTIGGIVSPFINSFTIIVMYT